MSDSSRLCNTEFCCLAQKKDQLYLHLFHRLDGNKTRNSTIIAGYDSKECEKLIRKINLDVHTSSERVKTKQNINKCISVHVLSSSSDLLYTQPSSFVYLRRNSGKIVENKQGEMYRQKKIEVKRSIGRIRSASNINVIESTSFVNPCNHTNESCCDLCCSGVPDGKTFCCDECSKYYEKYSTYCFNLSPRCKDNCETFNKKFARQYFDMYDKYVLGNISRCIPPTPTRMCECTSARKCKKKWVNYQVKKGRRKLDSYPSRYYERVESIRDYYPENSILERCCPEKGIPVKYCPEKCIPEKCYPEKYFPEKCYPEKCYPEKCYPEKCYPEKCYPEKCYPEKCIPEKCYPEKYIPEKIYSRRIKRIKGRRQCNDELACYPTTDCEYCPFDTPYRSKNCVYYPKDIDCGIQPRKNCVKRGLLYDCLGTLKLKSKKPRSAKCTKRTKKLFKNPTYRDDYVCSCSDVLVSSNSTVLSVDSYVDCRRDRYCKPGYCVKKPSCSKVVKTVMNCKKDMGMKRKRWRK